MLFRHIKSVNYWSLNPYDKCSFNCVYCIARSQGKSTPKYQKSEIATQIQKEIAAIPKESEIGVGAMSDAYPKIEAKLNITREALIILSSQERPFCITTKSDLVCRDIDILKNHKGHCDVYMSIFSLNENAAKKFEPGAPAISKRLKAIKRLHDRGIDVGIDASPWIPGISNATKLLDLIPDGINVQFAPLESKYLNSHFPRDKYLKPNIIELYLKEKERIGNKINVIWKMPIS